MIEVNNCDRIIGDFLEINADIVQSETNSKLPKFIRKRKSKKTRNKLLKSAKKIKNSNYILTTENLRELFVYVYNNYPPKGQYKSIFMVKADEEAKNIEAVISFDNCKAIITIEKGISGFDISISEKKSDNYTESCNIHCNSLYHDNVRSEILEKINRKLLDDLSNYVIDIISSYN